MFIGELGLGVKLFVADDAYAVRVVRCSVVACAISCILSTGCVGLRVLGEIVGYSYVVEFLRMGWVNFLMWNEGSTLPNKSRCSPVSCDIG